MRIRPIASGSSGNCYMVSDGYTRILIECGIALPRIRAAMAAEGLNLVSDIAGCLVSHEHSDHAKSAGRLAALGVDIYASPGTLDAAGVAGPRGRPLSPGGEWARMGTLRAAAFNVRHDAREPTGFIVRSGQTGGVLMYATDAPFIGAAVEGVTHLMIEANYDPAVIAGNVADGTVAEPRAVRTILNHMSIETAMDYIGRMDRSRLEQIWLIHLSDDNAAGNFKKRVQEIAGCEVYVA